mgnify:FL=1
MEDMLLFVYGTLRSCNDNDVRRDLSKNSSYVGEAYYRGKLYLVDSYPALISSDDPSDKVIGEVYRLHNSETIEKIDKYEECGELFPKPYEFIRVQDVVTMIDSRASVECFVYLYNRKVEGLTRIKSGDFCKDRMYRDGVLS